MGDTLDRNFQQPLFTTLCHVTVSGSDLCRKQVKSM